MSFLRLTFVLALLVATAFILDVRSATTHAGSSTETPSEVSKWDGDKYVVHEWGTFVSVSGSDGTVLAGLTHDADDLPEFVYDLRDIAGITGVDPKMETPVIYFYSPREIGASVVVDFPRGLITQWYPAASRVNHANPDIHGFPPAPRDEPIENLERGYVQWGTQSVYGRELVVLGPNADVSLPEVAADDPWRHSREVEANQLRVCNLNASLGRDENNLEVEFEYERFLFYRGLGDFGLPLTVTVTQDDASEDTPGHHALGLEVAHAGEMPALRHLFAIRVRDDGKAGFAELDALEPGETYEWIADSLEMGPVDQVRITLRDAVAKRLQESGLYTDEALAMANTWAHDWFMRPGLRVLYVMPETFVDEVLPLRVRFTGARRLTPHEVTRVFVGRTEVIVPDEEAALVELVSGLTGEGEEEVAKRLAELLERWGRFAQPYLRRALELAECDDVREAVDAALATLTPRR